MSEEQSFNEQQSLQLITEMIQKVKTSVHERGTSGILWGSVIGCCGLISFAQLQWNFSIGFDIWWLVLAAAIPQIWLVMREKKRASARTYQQSATDAVWWVYGISIAALILYGIIVPEVTDKTLLENGTPLLMRNAYTGAMENIHAFIPSFSSVYLIIYAFPTMATGLINHFKPMIWGAVICYGLFLVSLYTPMKYDMLLNGSAGIINWLIPGLILRKRYLQGKGC